MRKNLDTETICSETTLCLTISATPARASICKERIIYSRIPAIFETLYKLPHKAINTLEKAYTSASKQGAKRLLYTIISQRIQERKKAERAQLCSKVIA